MIDFDLPAGVSIDVQTQLEALYVLAVEYLCLHFSRNRVEAFRAEIENSTLFSEVRVETIARDAENLDVLVVVFANRRYRILDVEMQPAVAGSADILLPIVPVSPEIADAELHSPVPTIPSSV